MSDRSKGTRAGVFPKHSSFFVRGSAHGGIVERAGLQGRLRFRPCLQGFELSQLLRCAYHLSHPDIFVMESAEEWDCCE
jgi:hypothetical protein